MKKMKVLCLALAALMAVGLCGCGTEKKAGADGASDKKTHLTVYAAASMTETMNKLGEQYKAAHPDVDITFNFDSSGTLKTQIQNGAECDIFISAAQKQMNQLDAKSGSENKDNLDFIASDTRVNLLQNKVVLIAPEGNPKNVTDFPNLAQQLQAGRVKLVMGNSDVPVGQYTQKILKYFKLSEAELADRGLISYGSNVKEVTTQVKEGSVDCGVVYGTDAFSAGLKPLDQATADMCGQVIYPAAVMKNSKNQEAAKAFLAYLQGDEAMKVFEGVGFSKVS